MNHARLCVENENFLAVEGVTPSNALHYA